MCDRIAATGALEEAREQALAHVSEAKQALDGLDLSEQRTQALTWWPTASSSATPTKGLEGRCPTA